MYHILVKSESVASTDLCNKVAHRSRLAYKDNYVRLALLYSAEQYGITSPSCVHAAQAEHGFSLNLTSLHYPWHIHQVG